MSPKTDFSLGFLFGKSYSSVFSTGAEVSIKFGRPSGDFERILFISEPITCYLALIFSNKLLFFFISESSRTCCLALSTFCFCNSSLFWCRWLPKCLISESLSRNTRYPAHNSQVTMFDLPSLKHCKVEYFSWESILSNSSCRFDPAESYFINKINSCFGFH